MPLSDKFIGSVILTVFGVSFLFYLFLKLILIPLLPTDDNSNVLLFIEPKTILMLCETFGLMFIGGLSVYTYYNFVDNRWKDTVNLRKHRI